MSYNANATYQIGRGFYFTASGQQQTSDQPEQEQLVIDQVWAGLSYTRALFRGIFSASYTPGIEEERSSVPGEEVSARSLIQTATAAYQRRFGRWQTQEGFQYSHSGLAQSLVVPIVSESIVGTARASTSFKYHWNFSVGGSFSEQQVPGMNSTTNESIDAQVSTRSWSASGQFQKNSGYVVLTTAGIVNVSGVTAASGIVPTQYTDATTLSFSSSYTRRRLQLMGTYSWVNVHFDAAAGPVTSSDSTLDAKLTYKFRKIDVQTGFRRLSQFATTNSGLDIASHTYYISLVRRFHAF